MSTLLDTVLSQWERLDRVEIEMVERMKDHYLSARATFEFYRDLFDHSVARYLEHDRRGCKNKHVGARLHGAVKNACDILKHMLASAEVHLANMLLVAGQCRALTAEAASTKEPGELPRNDDAPESVLAAALSTMHRRIADLEAGVQPRRSLDLTDSIHQFAVRQIQALKSVCKEFAKARCDGLLFDDPANSMRPHVHELSAEAIARRAKEAMLIMDDLVRAEAEILAHSMRLASVTTRSSTHHPHHFHPAEQRQAP